MILFYIDHMAGLSRCVSLLAHRHPGEKAVLLHVNSTNFDFSNSNFAKQLISHGIFSQIIETPCWTIQSTIEQQAPDDQEIYLLKQFDSILAKNKIALNDCEQIYVFCEVLAHFPIYLCLMNISYTMIEPTTNHFTRGLINWIYSNLNENGSPNYANLLRKFNVLYDTEYTIKRLRLDETSVYGKKPDFSQTIEKDEWIDFDRLWWTLPGEFNLKLSQALCFDAHCLSNEQACLVLSNSPGFASMHAKLYGNYTHLPYQLMIDYYAPKYDLVIKEHPKVLRNSLLENYLENIVTSLASEVPFEFFTLTENFSVRRVLSIASTSSVKVRSYATECIELGLNFWIHFPLLHKAFCIFSLAQKVATPSTTFYATGTSMEFLGKFVECAFPEFSIKDLKDRHKDTNAEEDAFIIVGSISAENKDEVVNILDNATENTKVVLLNVKNVKNQWSVMPPNFVPITITKKATKEEGILDCLDSELFYFYSPNPVVREAVQAFTLEKTLKQTKLHLSARALPSANASLHGSVANFIDSWGYHTEKDNPILKQLQLRGKFEKDYPVNLTENEDPSSLKIQLLGDLLAKQLDLSKKTNALEKQIETLKGEKNSISHKIEELIAENKRLSTENAEIIAKNTTLTAENAEIITKNAEIIAKNATLIAENANLMRDIESLRLPRWLGQFLSNLHPKKKNRQRFREKYVKHKRNKTLAKTASLR